MAAKLTGDEALAMRLAGHGLTGRRARGVAGVLGKVWALQAQDTRAARLAVRARGAGLKAATVDRAARGPDPVAVRTWAMRGTLHMIPAADVAWVVGLLGPRFAARGARRRAQLGLDDATCERALELLTGLLAGGPLTRAELIGALVAEGLEIERRGQAPAHLLGLAALRGVICRGPERDDGEPTYVPLATWVPGARQLDGDEALAELARRYLGGHGPAGAEDLAAWSGLPAGQARKAIAAAAAEPVTVDGREAFLPAGTEPVVPEVDPAELRLLGAFDAWLLGWRERSAVLPARYAKRVQAGGGWLHPVVLAGGRAVGTWSQERKGGRLAVTVAPFGRLDRALVPGIEAEVADLGRFLGLPVQLVPLT